jgi:hypothetical protein
VSDHWFDFRPCVAPLWAVRLRCVRSARTIRSGLTVLRRLHLAPSSPSLLALQGHERNDVRWSRCVTTLPPPLPLPPAPLARNPGVTRLPPPEPITFGRVLCVCVFGSLVDCRHGNVGSLAGRHDKRLQHGNAVPAKRRQMDQPGAFAWLFPCLFAGGCLVPACLGGALLWPEHGAWLFSSLCPSSLVVPVAPVFLCCQATFVTDNPWSWRFLANSEANNTVRLVRSGLRRCD